jgi:uncharacterized Zn finger protein
LHRPLTSDSKPAISIINNRQAITMSWYPYKSYVPVAARRAKAQKLAQKKAKKGEKLSPVLITGGKIARSFWGTAWCKHLESCSDYENRLPRGRTYVRNGSVIDLQIERARIRAQVMGSELYSISVDIAPLAPGRWQAIRKQCAGEIGSLVDLLCGRFSDSVMRIITDPVKGMFPSPKEIKKRCSCPDHATLCKHLAAVFYGVGARLDTQPELLFLLRGVDHTELLEEAAKGAGQLATGSGARDDDVVTLEAARLADVFGIDIDTGTSVPASVPVPLSVPVAEPVPAAAAAAAPATPGKKTSRRKPAVTVKKRTGGVVKKNRATRLVATPAKSGRPRSSKRPQTTKPSD